MPKVKKPPVENPSRGTDTRRQGKKSVSWKDDPEILQRLAIVAQLMNRHKRPFEIAVETKVSLPTAKLDISRVRQLWKEDAKERIAHAKDVAIAQYAATIGQAWDDVPKVKPTNPARAAYLNVILRAQRQIDAVSGIAQKHEITGRDGGPIEHSVVDIEKVRKKRWEQVQGNLAALQQKEPNDEPTPNTDQNDQKPE